MVKKRIYTGYRDKYDRSLRVGDKVYYYVDYLGDWARGEIICRDDMYRVSHSFGIEILNDEVVKRIRKVNDKKIKK